MEAAASATIKLARLDIEAACLEGPRGVVEGARSTPETWVACTEVAQLVIITTFLADTGSQGAQCLE